jgi:hypothetical protein
MQSRVGRSKCGKGAGKVNVLTWGDLSFGYQSNSDREVRLRRQGSAEAIVSRQSGRRAEHREDEYAEQFVGRTSKTECLRSRRCCANEMGEACGSCAEGRAVPGTRQKKIQRKTFCAILGEPPDAAPHVRCIIHALLQSIKRVRINKYGGCKPGL